MVGTNCEKDSSIIDEHSNDSVYAAGYPSEAFSAKNQSANNSSTTTKPTTSSNSGKKYTVKFKGNGGSVEKSSIKAVSGSTITLLQATRKGYSFMGWSPDKKGTTALCKGGEDFEVTKNFTLYAVWGYKVTFNGNKGTAGKSSQLAAPGKSIKLPDAERDGYDFLGWSTSKSAEKATYKEDSSYKVKKNITLYAVWKEVPFCTVTFDANGGEILGNSSETVNRDASIILPAAIRSTGKSTADSGSYMFMGWSTSASAKTAEYESGKSYKVSSNTTLYAVWGEKSKWSADYRYWSQGASKYSDSKMKSGCWITSIARLIYETGIDRTAFNPDVLYDWLYNHKKNGKRDLLMSDCISLINGHKVPVLYAEEVMGNYNLTYEGATTGSTATCEKKILENVKAGYYSIAKKVPENKKTHYFLIANEKTKNKTIYIYETWSAEPTYAPCKSNYKIDTVYTYSYKG